MSESFEEWTEIRKLIHDPAQYHIAKLAWNHQQTKIDKLQKLVDEVCDDFDEHNKTIKKIFGTDQELTDLHLRLREARSKK